MAFKIAMKTVAKRGCQNEIGEDLYTDQGNNRGRGYKTGIQKKPTYFTRTRKMSFSELVYYILHPGKESTHLGLRRFFSMLGKEGRRMSEQAFSKARSHFSHWPFEKMVRATTEEEYHSGDARRWNGYHLFAIDSTTVTLPDKPSLCKAFGGAGRKKDSATASASILYDIVDTVEKR